MMDSELYQRIGSMFLGWMDIFTFIYLFILFISLFYFYSILFIYSIYSIYGKNKFNRLC